MRRAVVALPNGFTLFNLFCGIYAIVLSSRREFDTATFYIVLGGIADVLDGRIARATGTGSRFGEELDSLVDAISFGLAPAMMMYFAVLDQQGWDWIFIFIFTSCAVSRLARFNVEQAGRAKTHFRGLPSPAAGLTLASYWWFSQTSLYNEAIIFFTDHTTLAALPWQRMMRFVMVALAYLMVSDVPYPAIPTLGWRTPRQWIGTIVVVGSLAGLFLIPKQFIFPALTIYVAFGIVRATTLGFFVRRRGSPESVYGPDEPDADAGEPIVPRGPTGPEPDRAGADYRRRSGVPPEPAPTGSASTAAAAIADEEARIRKRKRRRKSGRGGSPRRTSDETDRQPPDGYNDNDNPTSTPDR